MIYTYVDGTPLFMRDSQGNLTKAGTFKSPNPRDHFVLVGLSMPGILGDGSKVNVVELQSGPYFSKWVLASDSADLSNQEATAIYQSLSSSDKARIAAGELPIGATDTPWGWILGGLAAAGGAWWISRRKGR